jgi:hypothetical protein
MDDDAPVQPIAAPAPDEVEWGRDDEDDETAATPSGGDEEGGDDAPFKKTYVVLDGVSHDELQNGVKDEIIDDLTDKLLRAGVPISGVRIPEGDTTILEYHA